ncbi:hypothetical protein HMPREF1544_01152 [Mucor circinelloides 1006PhL]|uniref:RRM domain-containing protein n=1 Tax=Mucor circinelloides f. circinelloides (strain 1006PhL) TaxID=1220926 RepID=S2K9G7_MUCC1|nr:hypothetical protein HMPREF1544_01152 [Mucor circinelloides 1006PhL]
MWYLKEYDPIKAGSIDGTDTEPHDAAVDRATQSQYRPPHFLKTDPNCTVFVGRLSFDTVESALKTHFEKYGDITSVSIIRNQVTGLSQGYGFVSFALEKDAKYAYKEANKSVLDDHVILVDFERSRVMADWVPRRLGGGFGGKKDSGQLRFGARDRPFKPPASSHVRIPYEQKFSDTWKYHHSPGVQAAEVCQMMATDTHIRPVPLHTDTLITITVRDSAMSIIEKSHPAKDSAYF